jgi:hypothetical protein
MDRNKAIDRERLKRLKEKQLKPRIRVSVIEPGGWKEDQLPKGED